MYAENHPKSINTWQTMSYLFLCHSQLSLSLITYDFSVIPAFSDIHLKVDRICLNMELERL